MKLPIANSSRTPSLGGGNGRVATIPAASEAPGGGFSANPGQGNVFRAVPSGKSFASLGRSHAPECLLRRQTESPRLASPLRNSGFTMIEVALCLAIMGFALVSILLVLPSGMNTQRDTRQETIINQDATVLLEAIRGGSRGYDDLTNYVYAITNSWVRYDASGHTNLYGQNGYTFANSSVSWPSQSSQYNSPEDFYPITNGLRIVGLLSTPLYTDYTDGFSPITNVYSGGYSNHLVAYVRSISGLAAEKPPQDNSILQENTFTYRVICVNAPMVVDTNELMASAYSRQLAYHVQDLRLLFQWPLQPNGQVGNFRQNYRATIAGQFFVTNPPAFNQRLYFYQSDTFTNTP